MYPNRVFGVPRCVLFIEVSSIYTARLYLQVLWCIQSKISVPITKLSIKVYVHLTHRPGSQGWAPRSKVYYSFFCLFVLFVCGALVLSFLPFFSSSTTNNYTLVM